MTTTPQFDMDSLRAGAQRCDRLARLIGHLDDPERGLSKVREAIEYHLTETHPSCPAYSAATQARVATGTCTATRDDGALRCWLPAEH